MNTKLKIYTLQSLRCFAVLGVFLCHTSFKYCYSLGHWGTSVFLVLSGFLMTYNYYGSDTLSTISVKSNIGFAKSKINKVYPLHIFTMLVMVLMCANTFTDISDLIIRLILNSLLIKDWFPIRDFSLNGTSWYLCTAAFTYFLFPYINDYMEKKYTKRKAFSMIFITFIIECIIGFFGIELQKINVINELGIKHNLFKWFSYYFPLSRSCDFFIGCNLAYIYIHKNHDMSKDKYTILELLSIILVVISNIFDGVNDDIDVWYERVPIFTLSTVILVYVFAVGKGFISNFLTNRITLYLAKISPAFFLIHSVVFSFMEIVLYICSRSIGEIYNFSAWIKLVLGFILTVISCEMWNRLIKYLEVKKLA